MTSVMRYLPPTLVTSPWLFAPRGGHANVGANDELILTVDLDTGDELVLLCQEDSSCQVQRRVTSEAPRRVVRFPWGDVPSPWVSGYSTIYDSGIDDAVFALYDDPEGVYTSLEDGDDPSWEQAYNGNESQGWCDSADGEYDNLNRFGVIELWPADKVPLDEDIYDTMLVCKIKRGQENKVLKKKVRCVLCGNQMIASAKRGLSKTSCDLRTHSPAWSDP